jgi:hypothetical protein
MLYQFDIESILIQYQFGIGSVSVCYQFSIDSVLIRYEYVIDTKELITGRRGFAREVDAVTVIVGFLNICVQEDSLIMIFLIESISLFHYSPISNTFLHFIKSNGKKARSNQISSFVV